MKTYTGRLLMLALAASLTVPVAVLAAEKGSAKAATSKAQAAATVPGGLTHEQMQARMQTMQARMHAIEQTEGDARLSMMSAQMADMQAMMQDMGGSGCPMAGGQGAMGMHGRQAMPMMPGMHGSQAK